MKLGEWIGIKEATLRQLSKVGIPAKFGADFWGSSEKWPARRWQDFFQREDAARMNGGAGGQIMAVLPSSVQAMPDFTTFQNELRGYNEVVRWPLYSYKAYATTGHTQLVFFDQNEGTATLGRADTNMQAAGQLPGNQMHVAHALRVVPFPAFADVAVVGVASGVAFGEWYRVLSNGCWAECTISDKLYLVAAPLFLLPQGMGPGSFHNTPGIALANTISIVNNGLPSNEAMYRLDPPLGILPTRTFSVTLNWRAVQTVTTAGRIGCILDGWRLRSVQ